MIIQVRRFFATISLSFVTRLLLHYQTDYKSRVTLFLRTSVLLKDLLRALEVRIMKIMWFSRVILHDLRPCGRGRFRG